MCLAYAAGTAHPSWTPECIPGFSSVSVTRCLMLYRSLFFFFWPLRCLSIYGFLLPIWYLKTLVRLIKISYLGTLFKVRYLQDSGVLRVRFRHVLLHIYERLNIQLMTFHEVNTRIDQLMEHDIHRDIRGEYHVPWVDQSLYSPKLKVINCLVIRH